ncbi:GPI mannosyltransferase 1 subunit M [Entomortierella parvispora]|uniref:GPI mannosyltransferase 1 n=1 Tax=Entomortierella parvispora TaxID=205924 RepID=A0A9P3H451_9FUNG|nr:GPI mannosyltransferase 1 subunit M [Entomortierella parvispora]
MLRLPSFDVTFRQLIGASVALHAILLIYGHWQDTHLVVKYTDIDYVVFTDASRYLTQGLSPYRRATYRYTPLLAQMLMPNIYLHESFGKWIFTGANLLIGVLIQKILRLRGMSESRAVKFTALWLLNPMVANISTRGNAESVIGAMVLGSFYLIMKRRIGWGAFFYGLSVHFKTYPIIYSIALLVMLDDNYGAQTGGSTEAVSRGSRQRAEGASGSAKDERSNQSLVVRLAKDAVDFITWRRIQFGLLSGGWFFLITGLMYYFYGYEFLFETYLYHVTRKDHRHNFSFWFYNIYLTFTSPTGTLVGVLTFVPQLALVLAIGCCFGKDIFFCAFLQTFAFVAWNKVCTAQYFMWYIVFLPLLIPCLASNPRMSLRSQGRNMLLGWVVSQALWLSQAYNLEFLGLNTFWNLFLASAFMYATNVWILAELITGAEYEPIFGERGVIRQVWSLLPGNDRQ